MAANTTASAFTRLQPINQPNIGGIVEEWTRYWEKNKDDEEARALARQAKEQEMRIKANKARADSLAGIKLEDSGSYFRDQVVSNFEEQKPELARLKLEADNGNVAASLKYSEKVEEFKNLVNLDKVSGESLGALIKTDDKFNEALDADKKSFAQNVLNSRYRIKGNKVIMLNEDGTDVDSFSVQSMLNKLKSVGTYSGKFDPTALGSEIADTIKLDDADGNQVITEKNRLEAIAKTQNRFAQDPVAVKSWAYKKGYPKEELNDLSEQDLFKLSKQFAEEEVYTQWQEKDNSLANAARRQSMARTGQLIKKGKKDEDADRNTFSVSTDDLGNVLQKAGIDEPIIQEEGNAVVNFKKRIELVDGSTTEQGIYTKDGNFYPILNITDEVPDPNDDLETVEVNRTILERDAGIRNIILSQLEDDQGRKFQDLGQFNVAAKNKIGEKQNINSGSGRGKVR